MSDRVQALNICCGLFGVISCADDDEHAHIGCGAKNDLDNNPVIDNEHAKTYCLSEQFKECPFYPKWG